MLIETLTEDRRWLDAGLPNLAERAARAVLAHFELASDDGGEISILGCNDARIATLNGDFRDKPQPTNVLSWPTAERGAKLPGCRPDLDALGRAPELGDIAIAYETCLAEARQGDKPFADHVTHLLVHAVLHLLGYDHIRDEDATLMQTTEAAILGKMGISDPYCL